MAKAKPQYRAIDNIEHDGLLIAKGSVTDLFTEESAALLIRAGALEIFNPDEEITITDPAEPAVEG
jgi:hypothetical protein